MREQKNGISEACKDIGTIKPLELIEAFRQLVNLTVSGCVPSTAVELWEDAKTVTFMGQRYIWEQLGCRKVSGGADASCSLVRHRQDVLVGIKVQLKNAAGCCTLTPFPHDPLSPQGRTNSTQSGS